MMRSMRHAPPLAALLLIAALFAAPRAGGAEGRSAVLATAHAPAAAQEAFPDAPGRDVVERVCTTCHGAEITTSVQQTAQAWRDTLDLMKSYGATATDAEWKTVADYIVANLAHLGVNKAPAGDLALVLAIGEQDAEGVIAYRDEQGGFKSVDDLKKAPGVDAARVDTVKARLTFE